VLCPRVEKFLDPSLYLQTTIVVRKGLWLSRGAGGITVVAEAARRRSSALIREQRRRGRLDIQMPGRTAWRYARRAFRGLPVGLLILTAYDDDRSS